MVFAWPMMRVEASMVMVCWEDGAWFFDGGEEALEALWEAVVVFGVVRAAGGLGRVGGWVWGGMGWAAILVLGEGDESDD